MCEINFFKYSLLFFEMYNDIYIWYLIDMIEISVYNKKKNF